jgi:hypothetical protein
MRFSPKHVGSEQGNMLMSVVVAMGLLAILMPIYNTFITNSMRASELQNIEADLEDLRIVLRGRFGTQGCDETKNHEDPVGTTQLSSCQAAAENTPIEIKAIDSNRNVILEKYIPPDPLNPNPNPNPNAANYLGRYHLRMRCVKQSSNPAPGAGELYFEVRRENTARTGPATHPTRRTPMEWTRLFRVPICDWRSP